MKAKPAIAVLLGCLMMVIMGHNIVPHNHHSGIGHSLPDCEQHDACEHSGDHSGDHAGECNEPTGHCHAFNGLEYVPNSDKKPDKESITTILSCSLKVTAFKNDPLPREEHYGCSGGAPPEFEGFLGESAGLRAPPHIS